MRRDMISVRPCEGRSARRYQGRRSTICLDNTGLAWFHGQVHAHGGGDDHTLTDDVLRNDIAEEDPLDLPGAILLHFGGPGRRPQEGQIA
jgi:hypothetical protein